MGVEVLAAVVSFGAGVAELGAAGSAAGLSLVGEVG